MLPTKYLQQGKKKNSILINKTSVTSVFSTWDEKSEPCNSYLAHQHIQNSCLGTQLPVY